MMSQSKSVVKWHLEKKKEELNILRNMVFSAYPSEDAGIISDLLCLTLYQDCGP